MDEFVGLKSEEKKRVEELIAIALKHKLGTNEPPAIVARGKGEIAKAIIEEARKHKIPINNNPALAKLLAMLDIDEFIPIEAYMAVAEILTQLYKFDIEHKKEK